MESEIKYIAVIVAALSSLVVGSLWYGPLFKKPWMTMTGLTTESMKAMAMTPMKAALGGFIVGLLSSYMLAWLAGALGLVSIGEALGLAFWCWIGFAVPISASGWLWEGKPFKLFLLYAGYYLMFYVAASLIVVLW